MAQERKSLSAALAASIRAQLLAAENRTVPTLRKIRRTVTHRVKGLDAEDVVRLALQLLSTRVVPKWFTYEVVHHHRHAMAHLTGTQIRQLGNGLAGWSEVDAFACYLAGPAWRDGRIGDKVVHRWAVAADRWWRRVAVVSTVPLNNTARGRRYTPLQGELDPDPPWPYHAAV